MTELYGGPVSLSIMMTFMYSLCAILVLVGSIALFRRAAGSLSLTKLNMSSYVFWLFLGTAFLGSTAHVTGIFQSSFLDGKLSDPSLYVVGWAGIMYSMIALPLGMILSNFVFSEKSFPRRIIESRERKIEPVFRSGDGGMRLALMVATALGLVGLLFTWSQLASVPLLEVFAGERDPWLLAEMRATASLTDTNRLLLLLITLILQFLGVATLAAYCYWVSSRRKTDLLWFAVALTVTFLYLGYDVSKTKIIFFMSGLLVVMVLARNGVSRRFISTLLSAGLGFVVTMYVVYRNSGLTGTGTAGLGGMVFGILAGRIGSAQMGSYVFNLDIFPRVHPHIWFGSTGRAIHEVLGLEFLPDYGLTTMAYFDPVGVEQGTAGHMTAIFLGEAWANFGWLGLIFAPLLVGFVIQTVHRWFLHARKTPLHLGLYGYVTYASFNVATSGIKGFYYPMWLVELVAITSLYLVLAILFRALRRPSKYRFVAGAGEKMERVRP